jgi:hypothetical protein
MSVSPNSTILTTHPDANLLDANQERLETAPAPTKPRSVSSQTTTYLSMKVRIFLQASISSVAPSPKVLAITSL